MPTKRTAKRDPRIVNRNEAADYAGVTKETIRRWIREGKLKEIRLGEERGGISLDDLDRIRATWPGGWTPKAAGIGEPVSRWPMIGPPSGA